MHIVFFNRSFYPDITATSQLLIELCEDLVKNYNCQVQVVAGMPLNPSYCYSSNHFGGLFIREDFRGINILRVRNTSFAQKYFLGRILNYLTYFFLSFFASFRLKKPDLVITLTDPPIVALIGLWLFYRFRVPFIISVRDIFPEAARGLDGAQNKIMDFLLEHVNRFCFKKARHVIALGKMMRKRLIEDKGLKPDKISIISDWVDTAKIFPVPKKNPFSVTNNICDYFVVMYSGNLGASSGVEVLIESARLLKDYKDILFVFIGEGIKKERLIKLNSSYQLKNTRFFTYQPQEVLSYSFSSADIFVVPLKKGLSGYSLPSKIYAILASGRPYIATVEPESEISEITKNFECGILAKPEDPKDLADKITFFYKNKELAAKMRENARKAAFLFDRHLGTQAYYELFQRLLSAKKSF